MGGEPYVSISSPTNNHPPLDWVRCWPAAHPGEVVRVSGAGVNGFDSGSGPACPRIERSTLSASSRHWCLQPHIHVAGPTTKRFEELSTTKQVNSTFKHVSCNSKVGPFSPARPNHDVATTQRWSSVADILGRTFQKRELRKARIRQPCADGAASPASNVKGFALLGAGVGTEGLPVQSVTPGYLHLGRRYGAAGGVAGPRGRATPGRHRQRPHS